MPFLRANAAEETKNLKASAIMAREVISLPTIANMESCKKALLSNHNAYPVVNTADRLVGLIPKSILVKLLEKKAFYNKESCDRATNVGEDNRHSLNVEAVETPLLNNTVLSSNDEEGSRAHEWDL